MALRNVPNELYEASNIDGASGWTQFSKITVPMISSSLFFVLIVNMISSLQIFDQVYTMYFGLQAKTSPAASSAGLFYNIYLFRQAFEFLHMGFASAMACCVERLPSEGRLPNR